MDGSSAFKKIKTPMRRHLWAVIPAAILAISGTPVYADGDAAAGREVYLVYGCAVCHGKEGRGDGMTSQGMYPPPTNLHDTSTYSRGYDKDSVRHSIRAGITGENSIMPPFPHISGRELEDLVAYVTSLQTTRQPDKGDGVVITGAWIKALPPAQTATAVYFTVRNSSAKDIVLMSASSPVAGITEIHRMERKDGKMKMGLAGPIPIPAQGVVMFEPGGYHVMLIHLKQPLRPGDTVPVTVVFQDGKEISVNALVRDPA